MGMAKTTDVFDGPEWKEDDNPESEYDWSLDIARPSVEEQEARFQRSETGKFFSRILTQCPACEMHHVVSFCPFVFEDNPRHYHKTLRGQECFERQMENSQEFRDAVAFMRTTFVHRLHNHRHFPVSPSKLQDAPPLAKGTRTNPLGPTAHIVSLDMASVVLIVSEWLHVFDERVHFLRSNSGHVIDGWDYVMPPYSVFSGHYATTDHDGRPFLIAFVNSGHYDARMPYGMYSPHCLYLNPRLAVSASQRSPHPFCFLRS